MKTGRQIVSAILAAVMVILLFPMSAIPVKAGTDSTLGSSSESVTIWDGTAASGFASGTGTETDPYIIMTAEQLKYFADQVKGGNDFKNKYIKLGADIVLNDTTNWENWGTTAPANEWRPIGEYYEYYRVGETCYDINPFSGTFNGDGHSVSGIYIDTIVKAGMPTRYDGLFEYVLNGTVNNLLIEKSYTNGDCVGGVVGYNDYGTVSNCYNSGTVRGFQIGGVVGYNNNGTIINCCNIGEVVGSSNVGGVVGYNSGSNLGGIICCYNSGTVSGGNYVGGVVGVNRCKVSNCYNSGRVKGSWSVGGIAGNNNYTYSIAENCYNIGTVEGSQIGGIVGENSAFHTSEFNCYYLVGCAIDNDGRMQGGVGHTVNSVNVQDWTIGLTSEQMKQESSFTGFDFDTVWTIGVIDEYDYPTLEWQESAHSITRTVLASGICGASGDNLTWTLYDDGELVISGTGEMADWTSGTASHWKHNSKDIRDKITSVVISDGVTNIGSYAFAGCTNITDMKIPSSVKSVGEYSFFGCAGLTGVEIADGLASIGMHAFDGCVKIIIIVLPVSVRSIGSYAFSGCISLKSITLPFGLISIDDYAFTRCSSLTGILIPASVLKLGLMLFSGCTSLTAITVDNANTAYKSADGVLFNKEMTNLVAYPQGRTADKYTVPSSVVSIGDGAFWECKKLTDIKLPNGLHKIGSFAFAGCIIIIIVIPVGVETIGDAAFEGCEFLINIEIPSSVTSIGNSAFMNCYGMTSVTFAEGSKLETIGDYAFMGTKLENITFPTDISSIGKSAFKNCTELKNVYFTGNTPSITPASSSDRTFEIIIIIIFLGDKSELTGTEGYDESAGTLSGYGIKTIVRGDLDGNGKVESNDAIRLLYYAYYPTRYTVNQDCDFNCDGKVDVNDAIYLLYHSYFKDRYPLDKKAK